MELMGKVFHVVIEQDEDGIYVGKVPELRGCVSQGSTIAELMKNIKEAILLCLETKGSAEQAMFIGVERVEIA